MMGPKKLEIKTVLYHAISTYQILCVMVHRLKFHQTCKAILILPDFIVNKFPYYKNLVTLGIFDEVYLFPYLCIKHDPMTILNDTVALYHQTVPYSIEDFDNIYIAGAHFYFSLYVINCHKKFTFFEDAPGMIRDESRLYENLNKLFPIHASIAKENGLFIGNNPYVEKVYSFRPSFIMLRMDKRLTNFDIVDYLRDSGIRHAVQNFFCVKEIPGSKKSVIVLTEHFSNMGILNIEQQKEIYQKLFDKYLTNKEVIIKMHPDDKLDYSEIFPKAYIIKQPFPSELLPYVFTTKPKYILAISSTGILTLKDDFRIIKSRIKLPLVHSI